MGKLFGTDGIRGVAGQPPLDRDTIYRVGRCLTDRLKSERATPRILIGRDTRESGRWIEALLSRAVADAGGTTESCGVISTPAVSFLTTHTGADAGIVISASHNPYQDNGIKVFAANGMKFSDAVEEACEADILACALPAPADLDVGLVGGPAMDISAAGVTCEAYLSHLRSCLSPGLDFRALRLVLDCGHGALSLIAPEFLGGLGISVVPLHCAPDGRNINRGAGALHVEKLRAAVKETGADLGVAFDGDADRAMFVDAGGEIRDGDNILYLFARHLDFSGAPRVIVGTVMANLGLEVALEEIGFSLARTAVGDRYVLEEMLRSGAIVGGEQSGHIILRRCSSTGDGLLTALKVLETMYSLGQPLAHLCAPLQRFPQVLVNVCVREKIPFGEIPGLTETEAACREKLGSRSRIVLRYSGTEHLVRVMVEGSDGTAVEQVAADLAALFKRI